ncbi:protein shortage in chiasmata 1 ortholog-like [Mixophyes fleayi]|uniref:protein shortage in chiasmata 1 ortholog-like n=1 Tax=Mixophyes fleayi TaxID=3061075 RepID=UPI003F4DF2FB
MCVKLTAEEMSPASPNFHLTDAAKDILECLESNIDTKLLLLKVPHIQNKPQRLTIDELKKKISVNPEKSVDVTLEDNWWSKLGLIEKYNQSIEPLTANIPRTHNLAPSTMESVNRVAASQLERILEQKVSPMKQKASFHNHEEQSHDSSPSKIIVIHPPIQGNVNVPFADSFYTADNAHLVTHENEKVQSDVFLQNLPSTTTVLSINHVKPAEINLRDTCILHKSLDSGLRGPEKQANDDTDLLSSFISLRTKSSLVQGENKQTEKPPVQADKLNSRPEHKENHVISCDSISEARTQNRSEEVFKNHLITVHITPSDSQCQAYRVLQAEAVPVINKLVSFCVSACMAWNFASVTFDCTRFLLRQQEKIISDSSKIEYLSKAKHMYKSALGPCLNDMWRKLRIVQFVRDKTEEVNPKITALLQEMEKANMEHQQLQVLILTRMDLDILKETLNNVLNKTSGLKAISLFPASGNTFLEPKDVLGSLGMYSVIIINNQHIGNDFPWSDFSLVIEYDCTDCWLKLCQDLNVPHMTLKTCLPDALILETPSEKDLLCDMQVPYVFLSSEELINSTEILQILESRYNMTFIERDCNASLHLFGKTSQCAMITVDVSTVIILQRLDELMHDKSAENLILKLVALSLQYSCCWVLLYAKQRSHSDASISLLHIALVEVSKLDKVISIKVKQTWLSLSEKMRTVRYGVQGHATV